jgi:hypothetical protein
MPETIEDDLEQLLRTTFGSAEIARAWLLAPNPVLSGETPDVYLQRGDTLVIRKLLMMAETGMPT